MLNFADTASGFRLLFYVNEEVWLGDEELQYVGRDRFGAQIRDKPRHFSSLMVEA